MIMIGYDVSIEQMILERFREKIVGEPFDGNGGRCVQLSDRVDISDVKEIDDNWMYVYIDIINTIKYEIFTSSGKIILNSENDEFPFVKGEGAFSFVNGINMEEEPQRFKILFKQCMDESDAKIVLSEIVT